MSLINCPECNKEISDKASSCPHCGFPIVNQIKESEEERQCTKSVDIKSEYSLRQMSCQFCGKLNDEESMYCGYCGCLIDLVEIQRRFQLENLKLHKEQLEIQQKQLREQQQIQIQQKKMQAQQEKEYENAAKCPKCGSTSLTGNKKGFGVGKAVIGVAVAGPIGLIAGNINSKKVKVTCLKCGKQFWA